jgi:hypothetical protein
MFQVSIFFALPVYISACSYCSNFLLLASGESVVPIVMNNTFIDMSDLGSNIYMYKEEEIYK